jgi:hypothetical protein
LKSKYYLIASILSFLFSIFLPVHFEFEKYDEYAGYVYAALGWMTFPSLDFFCWIGNFTLLFGWIFYRKKAGLILSYISPILMILYGINHLFELNILSVREYQYPLFGYWLWFASSLLLMFATTNHMKYKKSNV